MRAVEGRQGMSGIKVPEQTRSQNAVQQGHGLKAYFEVVILSGFFFYMLCFLLLLFFFF